MDSIDIRPADENDVAEVASMIQALNNFQHYSADSPDEQRLLKDGLGSNQTFHTFLAETTNAEEVGGKIVKQVIGMISYSLSYFITLGRIVVMTGLYVKPQHRSKGIGKMLYNRVTKIAFEENDCIAVVYFTRNDNSVSKIFYKKLGAVDVYHNLSFLPMFHFNGNPIQKLP